MSEDGASATLAIHGGEPAVRTPDLVVAPRLGNALYGESEVAAVQAVIETRSLWRYQGGDRVATFETAVAARFGDAHRAVAVNSGTSALHLMFAALAGRTERRTVGIPTIGFVSAATAALAAGFTVEFLPVERSLGLDVAWLADRLDLAPDLAAVLAVHPYGEPCAVEAARDVAHAHGATLLEDAAQCFGGSVGGCELGGLGLAGAFSFQSFKLVSTGEGGMVVTADAGLADDVQLLHDAAAPWTSPHRFEASARLTHPPLNLRMSELEGALGVVQLQRVPAMLDALRRRSRLLRACVEEHERYEPRWRHPGAGVESSVVFYAGSRHRAVWTVDALRAEGVNATLLVPEVGGNRHWAGTWSDLVRKCGAAGPPVEIVARDHAFLQLAVHVPVMLAPPEIHVEQTATALRKVLGAA